MSQTKTDYVQEGSTFIRKEPILLAPIHALNVLFEGILCFLCTGKEDEAVTHICTDSFFVGTGAIISLIVLLSGEAETNSSALQAVSWYHFVSLCAQFHRALYAETWLNIFNFLNLGHLAGFIIPLWFALARKIIRLDTIVAISTAGIYISTGSSYQGNVVRSLVKVIPVLLMSRRLSVEVPKMDIFTFRIFIGQILCAIADFLLEHVFLGGLAFFFMAHVAYTAAFWKVNQTRSLPQAVPIFGYALCLSMVLAPHLNEMLVPVLLYIFIVSVMLWRASMVGLGSHHGKLIAFGALAFALSDTLIGLDRFLRPIDNARFPIMTLYWLGQALITHGSILHSQGPAPPGVAEQQTVEVEKKRG